MARLRLSIGEGRRVVRISGAFSSQDLRRLEQLCGPALEQRTAPVTLSVAHGSTIDDSARAYLDRLIARGAILRFD